MRTKVQNTRVQSLTAIAHYGVIDCATCNLKEDFRVFLAL
jgi:hypothetical protein